MVLFFLLPSAALAGDVLLNEVLYDPSGSDDGLEWVELCNAGKEEMDLTGWKIEGAGTAFATSYTFASGTLAPGEYLLVGYGSKTHPGSFSSNLPNGGSETDGVRLLDSTAAVRDTLLFDTPNTYGLLDDSGLAGSSFATDVSAGHSLGRWPDCTDTDDSAVDFLDYDVTTAGAPNTAPVVDTGGDTGGGSDTGGSDTGGSGACSTTLGLVVNEFVADPSGGDGDALGEWVEVYNNSGSAADLSGWQLQWGTGSFNDEFAFPDGAVLEAGGYMVIGESGVSGADFVVSGTMGLGNATSNIDALRLVDCLGDAKDTVVYGTGSNSDGWVDDNGTTATSFAPKPKEGQSTGRDGASTDTNQCLDDFSVQDVASMGAANGVVPACEGQYDVKINEFMPNPDGADDPDTEWIELFNGSDDAIDISLWKLQYGTSSYSYTVTLPLDTWISAKGYFVVGGALVAESSYVPNPDNGDSELKMGNASSSADAVRLVHCGGGPADTIIYGGANSDGWVDDSGAVAMSIGPTAEDGLSLARYKDGADSDECAVDIVVSEVNSPGGENAEVVPATCIAGANTIKVNEYFPNPAGSDTDYEWVELYNSGDVAVRLDAWTVETATSTWGVDYTFGGGVEIAAGGFALVGGPYVPTAEYIAESLSLGNASKAPDGVRIVDCTGVVQDTALYGDPEDEVEDALTDDVGTSNFAAMADENESIGRYPDGADTDDSNVDFLTGVAPTPGAANGYGSTTGGDTGKTADPGCGKGCSKSATGEAPDSNGPSKCGVVGGGGFELVLLSLVAAFRRRRRD